MKNISSTLVDYYKDYEIRREVDKRVDTFTGETYGHAFVFYAVVFDDCLIESFKTIKDARRYIDKIC